MRLTARFAPLAALLAGVCALAVRAGAQQPAPSPADPFIMDPNSLQSMHEAAAVAMPVPKDFIEVANRVMPSVVNISIVPRSNAADLQDPAFNDQLLRYLIEQRPDISPWSKSSTGSGVVFLVEEELGYILTNHHVIAALDRASELKLTFHREVEKNQNKTVEIVGERVRVIGRDRLSDLAVIEFEIPAGLTVDAVPFGNSEDVQVGEWVLALGSPLDLQNTVSQGIISNKNRMLSTSISVETLLQTTATIQPGNSGGPLVNLSGEIIGIVNAIASNNGLWQGIGFAIPGNSAKAIAETLMERGRMPRGYLGVTMGAIAANQRTLRDYGLESAQGVMIERVVRNSPADVAGLQYRDIVTSINGAPIRDNEEMLRMIAAHNAMDQIRMDVVRLNRAKEPEKLIVEAVLAERPAEDVLTLLHDDRQNFIIPAIPEDDDLSEQVLGLALEPAVEGNIAGLRITSVEPGSPAAEAGLEAGDVIVTLNSRRVSSPADFSAAMAHPLAGRHLMRYLRGGEGKTALLEE